METNPRKQSLKTDVAKSINKSLLETTDQRNFYLLNRGLLLSAKTVSYNNETKEISIFFEDDEKHGDVDGGHTYEIIKKNRDVLESNSKYVKIEILTGVEDMFEQLAKARNYSVKVQDKSMAELCGDFQIIKDALVDQPYYDELSYKENDTKRIDIMDILTLLNMFNIEKYPVDKTAKNHPIVSYTSKASCLKTYEQAYKESKEKGIENNPYYKMKNIIPDIVNLYEHLELKIQDYYKGDSKDTKKYGAITGVTKVKTNNPKFKTRFYGNPVNYQTPNGFMYPIIGAFRALVKEENGMYTWKIKPLDLIEKVGNELVTNTISSSRELGNNPNATGKSLQTWSSLFKTILIEGIMQD